MRQLNVYMNDVFAGVLTEKNPGNGYSFQYDKAYLGSAMTSVSVAMPKREEAYDAEYLFPVFTNMLPEGANRKAICRALRIDENDFFGLLTAMADKDVIGALNVRRIKND